MVQSTLTAGVATLPPNLWAEVLVLGESAFSATRANCFCQNGHEDASTDLMATVRVCTLPPYTPLLRFVFHYHYLLRRAVVIHLNMLFLC